MNSDQSGGRGVMRSWAAILLPLAIAVIGLIELIPRLRAGAFGGPELAAMIIIGLCLGFAGGAIQARRRK